MQQNNPMSVPTLYSHIFQFPEASIPDNNIPFHPIIGL